MLRGTYSSTWKNVKDARNEGTGASGAMHEGILKHSS